MCNGGSRKPETSASSHQDPKNPPDKVDGWTLDKQISSHPDHCTEVIKVLLDQLDAFGWYGRDAFGIHMAMEEAIINAIVHGNRRDPRKMVHVLARLTPYQFYARITDEGDGFDPLQVPDPTLEENLTKSCGRGVMLIKQFVDSAQYNSRGNSVELKKINTRAE